MLGPKYLCITYFFYFKQTSLYFIILYILFYYIIYKIYVFYIYMHPTQHGLLKSISAHGRGVAAR